MHLNESVYINVTALKGLFSQPSIEYYFLWHFPIHFHYSSYYKCIVSFIHCINKRKDTCAIQQNSLGKMSNGLFLFGLTLVNGSQQRFWRSYLLCTYSLCIQSLRTSCKLFVPKHNALRLVTIMSIQETNCNNMILRYSGLFNFYWPNKFLYL